ncbi:hypothetical protein FACS1894103_5920 [Campylobacterota bacterium]|nr:hypothetical protein FACS1894103_5920 [Campylobacterota bacterium]
MNAANMPLTQPQQKSIASPAISNCEAWLSDNNTDAAGLLLDSLKQILKVNTDSQLAALFELPHNTVCTWRSRNSVMPIINTLLHSSRQVTISVDGNAIFPMATPTISEPYKDFIRKVAAKSLKSSHCGVLIALIYFFDKEHTHLQSKSDLIRAWHGVLPLFWDMVKSSETERNEALQLLSEADANVVKYVLAHKRDFVERLKKILSHCANGKLNND